MALTPMPYLSIQEFDGDGEPLAGGKLFFYASGTTTKQNTYADALGVTPNANPLILDAAGRATIFWSPQTYKVVLAPASDTDPPTSPIWTRDGISAVPATNADLDIQGTAGEDLLANNAVYLSDGTGGRTTGRWYKTDADTAAYSIAAPEVGFAPADLATGVTGSIRRGGRLTGLSGLTASSTYYLSQTPGAITATPPTNALAIGTADSTTSLIIGAKIPAASATISGLVSLGAQTWVGVKTGAFDFNTLPTGIGAFFTDRLLFDATKNNSTTLVDILGLAFSALANASYRFELVIYYITSAASAGIKFAITGPAAPTAVRYGVVSTDATTSISTAFAGAVNAVANASGLANCAIIAGVVRNGANAGSVQLQFAQATADATNTIVYADSYLVVTRIA